MHSGAFQVMRLLKDARLEPDCKLYTTLISTCAKSGKVDLMFEVHITFLGFVICQLVHHSMVLICVRYFSLHSISSKNVNLHA